MGRNGGGGEKWRNGRGCEKWGELGRGEGVKSGGELERGEGVKSGEINWMRIGGKKDYLWVFG